MGTYEPGIRNVDKVQMILSSLNLITRGLVLSSLPLKTKRKLLFLYRFGPTVKQDLLSQAEEYPDVIAHLYRILYLLTRDDHPSKVEMSKTEEYYVFSIVQDGESYRFAVNAFPTPLIPVAHDLHPLVDIFKLRLYDCYPIRGKVVDIGGYIGDTAVYFLKNGASSVDVYEPNPYNFNFLMLNLKINNCAERTRAFQVAVTDSSGVSTLDVPRLVAGAGSLHANHQKSIRMDVNTVSCHETLDHPIELLKMDCKGSEVGIVLECGKELRENVDHVICQALDEYSLSRLLQEFRRLDFRIDRVNELYSMVYASRNG